MEKPIAELKLNNFDQKLSEKKEAVNEVGLWRLIIMSPWNFYFAIYKNLPLEKRTQITVRFFTIKLIELLFVVAVLFLINSIWN